MVCGARGVPSPSFDSPVPACSAVSCPAVSLNPSDPCVSAPAGVAASGWSSGGYQRPSDACHQPSPRGWSLPCCAADILSPCNLLKQWPSHCQREPRPVPRCRSLSRRAEVVLVVPPQHPRRHGMTLGRHRPDQPVDTSIRTTAALTAELLHPRRARGSRTSSADRPLCRIGTSAPRPAHRSRRIRAGEPARRRRRAGWLTCNRTATRQCGQVASCPPRCGDS